MNYKYLVHSTLGILILTSCISQRSKFTPFEIKQASSIQLRESLPSEGTNCNYFGKITAMDGEGIGDFGTKGNRINALTSLKVKAAQKQANIAIITKETKPHFNSLDKFFDNHYSIEANLYFCRKIN